MFGKIEYDKIADVDGNVRLWNGVLSLRFVYVAEFCFVHTGWSSGNPSKYGFDDNTFFDRVDKVLVASKGW